MITHTLHFRLNSCYDVMSQEDCIVTYQLHETAGELLKTQVFASPSRRLRGYALIGSDRKNRKRQNSTSKQM